MKRNNSSLKIFLFIILIIAIFTVTAVITAKHTRSAAEKKAAEQASEEESEQAEETGGDTAQSEQAEADGTGQLDKYSMQEFCAENSKAVFAALKAGDREALEKLMINPDGIDGVMEFADWSEADFDNAVTMGSGSLTAEPDEEDRMDESERFFVYAGDSRYVFFIETLTSRLGRVNEGVSAIGVTSFSHFDATDYAWNGEKDSESVLAGELFWNK